MVHGNGPNPVFIKLFVPILQCQCSELLYSEFDSLLELCPSEKSVLCGRGACSKSSHPLLADPSVRRCTKYLRLFIICPCQGFRGLCFFFLSLMIMIMGFPSSHFMNSPIGLTESGTKLTRSTSNSDGFDWLCMGWLHWHCARLAQMT